MEIWDEVYRQIYYIGIQTLRYGKRFFKGLIALLLKPTKVLRTLIVVIMSFIHKHIFKDFHAVAGEFRRLRRKAKSDEVSDGDAPKYRNVFVYLLNFLTPVVSLATLLNVIGFWSDAAFALEINYNNEVIGYVKDETVYREAQKLASERLSASVTSTGVSQDVSRKIQLNGDTEYNIRMVKRSQISDASEMCEILVEKSDSKITNACGVYIDDEFICAVKNETDALRVFDSILAEHETDEENAVVSFVENIDYVQGLYPDSESTIKDAEYLLNKLKAETDEARYYTAEEGDTLSLIAEKSEMTEEEIKELNPDLPEEFQKGDKVLLFRAKGFLRIKTTKTEYREEELPFETVTVNTNNLYVGDKKTVSKGENGLQQITSLVTYIDGVEVSTKDVSTNVIKEAISEKIQVGTKKKPVAPKPKPQPSKPSGNKKARLGWPTVGAYSISSPYGERDFGDGWHGGIDLVRPGGSSGCTVVASEAGVVTFAGWRNSAGYAVLIDHGNGISTFYCHMQDTIKVTAGQKVTRGQPIGNIGATGFVTGPHLHFEVRVNGKDVNPNKYLY